MKSNNFKKNAFVILNFRNYRLTLNLVSNLIHTLKVDNSQIIVVDNYSPDNSYRFLTALLPKEVICIQSGFNGGYGFGNNYGIRKARELDFEYITLMNNDVTFTSDFLSPLISVLEKNKNIAIVGPTYFDNEGNIHHYGGINNYIRGRTGFVDVQSIPDKLDIIKAEWILGAVITFRSKLVDDIGYIPEQYFLNFEENDWQQIARRKGYEIAVVKEAKVVHFEGATIGSVSGLQEYFMLRNKIIFEKRNARWYQKPLFWMNLVLGTCLAIIKDRKNVKRIPIYIDGVLGRNRYSKKHKKHEV
ncbi:glycosyltransferase [Leuconostoc citreum]|uniref:glycosyltransferase n=1 Tax=Leuconostoc citreum TaxID=33964 RepID=UPI000590288F|nr:glycosyltransferase [Leuconostoc citreum]MCP1276156.1 glycosyltransferase [Leuconostoc citreum]